MSLTPRRKRIAFLLNDLSSAYQARFLRSIEKAAHRHDVDLWVLCGRELQHPNDHERVQNVLYAGWLSPAVADGVIVLAAAMANYAGTDGLFELCSALHPLPVCSIGLQVQGAPSILIENRAGMRIAIDHLIHHHRRRRIAYIAGPADNAEAVARLAGYVDALGAASMPFDPDLVARGQFTAASGREAMLEILARTRDVDALATANDDMALGASDVLREHELSVSNDVLVVGFDNSPMGRYAPRSLTSVAQPLDHMADAAVRLILASIDGKPVPEVQYLDVHLVLRESCGCGYIVRRTASVPPLVAPSGTLTDYLARNEQALIDRLQPDSGTSRELWPPWATRLVRALEAELSGKSGTFLREVEEVAEDAAGEDISIDEVSRAVSELRAAVQESGGSVPNGVDIERLWMKALTILAAATTRIEGRVALDVQFRANELRHAGQRLSIALEPSALATALASSLPALGLNTALLAVHPRDQHESLEPLLSVRDGRALPLTKRAYAANLFFPPGFVEDGERSSLLFMALSFEKDVLGLVAFDSSADPFLCEALRAQISATLKLGALHNRVLEETALCERIMSQKLAGEMAIAKRLQTALTPRDVCVSGLEIAASMHPADQVGGDYYDVLPNEGGAWIGIGDVTGHGLLSGLIMLMIQSIVSTLCGTRPNARPSELVTDLNRVLFPNIRERLGQDEYATLVLMHYTDDGRVEFAGAHEDILVWRRRTGSCEFVPGRGVWLGIKSDIGAVTPDQSFELEPGDLLVLYTDGVVEARNSHGELFGIERLAALIAASAELPVTAIHDQILGAVRDWFPVQQDDVTCLVARHTAGGRQSSLSFR